MKWLVQHHPESQCWRAEELLTALIQIRILYAGQRSLLKRTAINVLLFILLFIPLFLSSHTLQDHEFFTQWCSLQNLFFILLAEYHWIGLLKAVECCFSSSQLRVLMNDQILASPAKPAGGKLYTSTGHNIFFMLKSNF